MKHVKLITILIMSLLTLSCSAQHTFSEISSIKGVTSVYFGRGMLKLAGNALETGNSQDAVDISKLAAGLTSIEIIQCDTKELVEKALPIADRVLAQIPFEVITEVIDDDTTVEISGVFNETGDRITMLLIKVLEDSNELTLILMTGDIDLDTLKSAINEDIS